MTKIVHVSNFSRRPKGAFQHSVEHKISNGLIRNGHQVLNFSDRDVARATALFGSRKFGVSGANKSLKEFCHHIRPEILVLGHADVITPQTLVDIRADIPSIKIVQWNVDGLFEPDNVRRIESKLDVVDATLISTAGQHLAPFAQKSKAVVGFLPNPVDFSIESGKNHEKDQLSYDVFFPCGNPTATRRVCSQDWLPDDLIGQVQNAIPEMRCLLSGGARPYLAGYAYQAALESAALGMNISRRNDFFLYSSDRLAQMCGNGMGVLIERSTGYDQLFSDTEFVFFSTLDELVTKTRNLIHDTGLRRSIAGAGRARYHALFNEQNVAKYIVEVATGTIHTKDYEWPTLYTPAQ